MANNPAKKMAVEALISNLGIGLAKLTTSMLTGSVGQLAETIHSFSDTLNQVLVLVGIKKSEKQPDKKHPFGYGKERFLWPFLVATLLFSISGIFSFQLGLFPILENRYEPLRSVEFAYIVLAAGGVIEARAVKKAYSWLKKMLEDKGQKVNIKTLVREFKENREPTIMTIIVEDSIAVFGVIVTAMGIFLSTITGNGFFDAASAVIVGTVLMVFAFVLAREFKDILVGKSISQEDIDKISKSLYQMPEVSRVASIKTMHLSAEDAIVAIDAVLVRDPNLNNYANVMQEAQDRIKQAAPYLDESKIYVKYQWVKQEAEKQSEAS